MGPMPFETIRSEVSKMVKTVSIGQAVAVLVCGALTQVRLEKVNNAKIVQLCTCALPPFGQFLSDLFVSYQFGIGVVGGFQKCKNYFPITLPHSSTIEIARKCT
jgi:hypothetical protein